MRQIRNDILKDAGQWTKVIGYFHDMARIYRIYLTSKWFGSEAVV